MPHTKGSHNIVVNPFPATARAEGRTEQVRINGAISKPSNIRLNQAPGVSMTQKLDACMLRLIELEHKDYSNDIGECYSMFE